MEGAIENRELGIAENEDTDVDRRGQGLLLMSPMLSKWDLICGWSPGRRRWGDNSDIRAILRI